MTVKDRIKFFCKNEKISVSEFEKTLNVANGYVNSISKSVGIDKINSILEKYPNLSVEWLLTGKGEMLKNTSPLISQTVKGNGNISTAGNNNINIPIQTTSQEKSDNNKLLKELHNIIKDKDKTIASLRKELKEKTSQINRLLAIIEKFE